jgi:DNA-binding CsgD family transcriptional regulator
MRWSAATLSVDPLAQFTDRRREIVQELMSGPLRLKEIADRLGTTESNAIQHLQKAIRDNIVVKLARGVYALEEGPLDQLAPEPSDTTDEDAEVNEVDGLLDSTNEMGV